jgi:hypothetical protein
MNNLLWTLDGTSLDFFWSINAVVVVVVVDMMSWVNIGRCLCNSTNDSFHDDRLVTMNDVDILKREIGKDLPMVTSFC